MCRIFVVALCCLGSMIAAARAEVRVSDAEVREAVSRSLPFLE